MIRVAIVGCGKIADSHAAQIQRIADCEIVAACDNEELMAGQFAERFGVAETYDSVPGMLEGAKPDVVHVTTPPQSHFLIASQCIEAGCHVYVEKPFTVDTDEAVRLLDLAREKGVKITAGHDDQFRHAARRMRKLVKSGYLGGEPVHMECYYGYKLSGAYAKALISDKQHWVRRLPGGLLQNNISHGIARIAEFMKTDDPEVTVHGFVSPMLRDLGEESIIDEVRVIISEKGGATAYFTFSSQMRPALHQFRLYGPDNGLILDQDDETLIKLDGKDRKSYLQHFVPPVAFAGRYLRNWLGNAGRFLRNDFHMKSGMKYLIEQFYRSIDSDAPDPIPMDEILRTTRIMERIFSSLHSSDETKAGCPGP